MKLENFLSNITEYILTACHSLTKIEGEIIGDPLEIETFLKSEARNGFILTGCIRHILHMIDVKSCEENSMLRMGLLSQKIIQNCQKSNPSHLLLKSLVNQL